MKRSFKRSLIYKYAGRKMINKNKIAKPKKIIREEDVTLAINKKLQAYRKGIKNPHFISLVLKSFFKNLFALSFITGKKLKIGNLLIFSIKKYMIPKNINNIMDYSFSEYYMKQGIDKIVLGNENFETFFISISYIDNPQKYFIFVEKLFLISILQSLKGKSLKGHIETRQ